MNKLRLNKLELTEQRDKIALQTQTANDAQIFAPTMKKQKMAP